MTCAGQPFGRNARKTTRTFLPFYVEEKVGSTTTAIKYYTFNGMTIAMRRGGTLTYLHSDHLGSNSVVTNADGTYHSSQKYCAYGGQRIATMFGEQCDPTALNPLPTDRTYTGQEQDTTGLMFYHARFYDPALGTFISPDTMVPQPGRVSDFNRFMYVGGNPLRFSDPSGQCRFDENGEWQFAIDCSIDEFDALTWEWRIRWMQDFATHYTSGQYFNNIVGIIEYFQSSEVFTNSKWAKRSDAGVLLAIQDGQRLRQGSSAIGDYSAFTSSTGSNSPDTAWQAFLESISENNPNLALWGDAEQLGVEYGTFVANPLLDNAGMKERIFSKTFVEFGNVYRTVVSSGLPGVFAPENCEYGAFCQAWTIPSFLMHPTYSRSFVKQFSNLIINPIAYRTYANSIYNH